MKPHRFQTHIYDADTHDADTPCPPKWFWCRIHWYPTFVDGHQPFPFTLNQRSSRMPSGWERVTVHCGPAAWFPRRAMPVDKVR